MLPAVKGIAELPGPTKTPPIFSEMTVIMQGGLQYEDKVDLKGPVAGVEREESQPHGQSPSPFHATTVLTFDDLGHLIRRIDENSTGISTMTNTLRDGKIQSQTVNHHSTLRKIPDWQDWRQWRYDEAGRLSDFRAGRDKTEINHYSNFKYDAQGRLLTCEYRQNGSDRPFSVTEISYVGNTATESTFDKDGHKYYEHAQIIDDRNRVVELKVSDVSAGQLKLWYYVTFKYDEQGRVVEQSTDPFKVGDGDDYSPIPGKLAVRYDDQNNSGEQKFYDSQGKLVLHTRFRFDRDGIPTSFELLDASGKPRPGSEFFVNPKSHASERRSGNTEWEVLYDDHGNWTERRRWFSPSDGGPRVMTRLVRQNITYR